MRIAQGEGHSILDDVREQACSLKDQFGSTNRETLDDYLTSVRELEQRLVVAEK